MQIIIGVLLAVLVFWMVGAYNRLMRLRGRIDHAFVQIDAQFRQRHELIAVLLEAAYQYIEHEHETLEAVATASRQASVAADHALARPTDAAALGALRGAEQALAGTLARLMTVAENYPELKADETVQEIGEQLAGTQGRLAFARQAFNDTVLAYNHAVQQFPTRLISRTFGFRTAGLLPSGEGEPEPVAPSGVPF